MGAFLKVVCQHAVETRFIEAVTSMGGVNQFNERAGFRNVGYLLHGAGAYGNPGHSVSVRSKVQSQMSRMSLYFLDRKEHGWWP